MAEKKYYWLKLKRDFFKRHDIKIIEAMPNGKEYSLFYLKLLCESVDHEGSLRFSEQIPYSEEMLATITDTNIEIVEKAIQVFTQFNMMEIMDNGTFFMREVEKMIGSETEWAEKKRAYRDSQKQIEDNSRTMSSMEKTESDKRQRQIQSTESDIESDTDSIGSCPAYTSEEMIKTICDQEGYTFVDSKQIWNQIYENGTQIRDLKAYLRKVNEAERSKHQINSFSGDPTHSPDFLNSLVNRF